MPQPPPNKFKLTDATASTLPVPATGQVFYWCNKQPGFCLRVTANGARAWVAQGRVNGKTCRVTLGRLEQLNTESARGHAKAALTLMFQGISPVERKRQVKMQSETLLEVLEEYISTRRTAFGTLRESTRKKYREHINVHCADWCSKPMTSITHTMVAQRFRKISDDAPAQANIVMGTLRTLFNYVRDKSIDAQGIPTICVHNPVVIAFKGLARYNHIKPRTRRIPTNKIGAVVHLLYQRLDADVFTPNDNHNAALALALIFTGARYTEMASLKWSAVQLDADEPCFTFTETKMHRTITLPITTHLMALFRQQYERRQVGNPYVFVGRTRKTYIKSLCRTLAHVGTFAGSVISPHDLRRTFTQVCDTVGVQSYIAELLTSHQPSSVTGLHYRESEMLTHYIKEAQQIADWLIDQRNIQAARLAAENVVELRRA